MLYQFIELPVSVTKQFRNKILNKGIKSLSYNEKIS